MQFARTIHGRHNLVLSLFDIGRPVRTAKVPDFQPYRTKFFGSAPVRPQPILVNECCFLLSILAGHRISPFGVSKLESNDFADAVREARGVGFTFNLANRLNGDDDVARIALQPDNAVLPHHHIALEL